MAFGKPPVALVAFLVLLGMHGLCVAEVEMAETANEHSSDGYTSPNDAPEVHTAGDYHHRHPHKTWTCAPGWGMPAKVTDSYGNHDGYDPSKYYEGENGDNPEGKQVCKRCAPGTFSAGGIGAMCESCGPYQTSPAGSVSRDYCSCQAGYGKQGNECKLCAPGTYWQGPPAEVSAGHGAPSATATSSVKVGIAAVSPQAIERCLPCSTTEPDHWTTLTQGATSQAECVCQPGYAGPLCARCQYGEICPGGTRDPPKICPPNSYAPFGATTVAECVCKPGTGRPATMEKPCSTCGPVCETCPAGTYSEGGTTDTCKLCGEGLTSYPGSTSYDDCVPADYCCGTRSCSTRVPIPPAGLPAGARIDLREEYEPPVNATPISMLPGIPLEEAPPSLAQVKPETVCRNHPREEVPFKGIARANALINVQFRDDANPSCLWNRGVFGVCTANLLAPNLVLTAAHCVEPQLAKAVTGCGSARLWRVVVCFNYNPGNNAPNYVCPPDSPDTQLAIGASWNSFRAAGDPYDQAILFLRNARPPPYFRYNYIENINIGDSDNIWVSRSFTGRGDSGRCGCIQCRANGVPCNLATSGPSRQSVTLTSGGAFNPGLEACGGSSGNAVTVNDVTCAVGTDSYEILAGSPCTSGCSNFWSSISREAPLSNLWSGIMVGLN